MANNEKTFISGFGIGVVIGVVISFLIAYYITLSVVSTPMRKLIDECQKELPRNQSCKFIAVPR